MSVDLRRPLNALIRSPKKEEDSNALVKKPWPSLTIAAPTRSYHRPTIHFGPGPSPNSIVTKMTAPKVSTGDALKSLNDEYLEIKDRFPGRKPPLRGANQSGAGSVQGHSAIS
jgi:hypothetical protein